MPTRLLDPDESRPNFSWVPSPRIALAAAVAGIVGVLPVVVNLLILPRYVFIASLIGQGVLTGYCVGLVFRWTYTRAATLIPAATLIAISLGASLLLGFLYVEAACGFAQMNSVPAPLWSFLSVEVLIRFSDQYLRPQTGYGGILGFIVSEWAKPESFFFVYLIEIVVMFFVGTKFARMQIDKPFCEGCRAWMQKPLPIAVLPIELSESLVMAVLASDEAAARLLYQNEATANFSTGSVRVYAARCPQCLAAKADVVCTAYDGLSKLETRLIRGQVISQPFFDALRRG